MQEKPSWLQTHKAQLLACKAGQQLGRQDAWPTMTRVYNAYVKEESMLQAKGSKPQPYTLTPKKL